MNKELSVNCENMPCLKLVMKQNYLTPYVDGDTATGNVDVFLPGTIETVTITGVIDLGSSDG